MTEHKLKCWPVFFDAILHNEKNFEVRRDDRGFQKGDILILQRTTSDSPYNVDYDYYEIRKRVSYILTGGQFGIAAGYVIMALADEADPV